MTATDDVIRAKQAVREAERAYRAAVAQFVEAHGQRESARLLSAAGLRITQPAISQLLGTFRNS